MKSTTYRASIAFALFLALTSLAPLARGANDEDDEDADQNVINRCLAQWKNPPFKKGTTKYRVIGARVKVLGLGSDNLSDLEETKKPALILVKPSVNVLGKSKVRLLNPNGWYCLKAAVNVLGKTELEAHCKAQIASASSGANVLGSKEGDNGVTVLGSLRFRHVGCDGDASESGEKKDEE